MGKIISILVGWHTLILIALTAPLMASDKGGPTEPKDQAAIFINDQPVEMLTCQSYGSSLYCYTYPAI